jgi:hypothetical protein
MNESFLYGSALQIRRYTVQTSAGQARAAPALYTPKRRNNTIVF